MFLALALAGLGVDGLAYTVVTKDGQRITVEGPPEFEGRRAKLKLAGGTIILVAADVDKEATRKANIGLAAAEQHRNAETEPLEEGDGLIACGPGPPEPADPSIVQGSLASARILKEVKPAYPPEAKAAGEHGVVVLEAIVDVEGKVSHVEVLRSVSRALDAAAKEAVGQWEFEPARSGDRPVRVRLTVAVRFNFEPAALPAAAED